LEKFIPLKPIFGMRFASSVIGLIFISLALFSMFSQNSENSNAELVYILIGILFIAISLQNFFLGDKKYIKITESKIEIKKWILSPKINIDISKITKIRIVGSSYSIKYADTQELINLDWISGYSKNKFSKELEKLSNKNNFEFEIINILDKFKNKEL
jgi:hypothetical protein